LNFLPFTVNCNQGRPKTCGRPGQANKLALLQTDIIWTFSAYKRAGEHFWGRVPKLRIIFGGILSRVETSVYYHHISDYSNDVWVPLIGWHPGQLPGWPAP
jgi:hypothetical protein